MVDTPQPALNLGSNPSSKPVSPPGLDLSKLEPHYTSMIGWEVGKMGGSIEEIGISVNIVNISASRNKRGGSIIYKSGQIQSHMRVSINGGTSQSPIFVGFS